MKARSLFYALTILLLTVFLLSGCGKPPEPVPTPDPDPTPANDVVIIRDNATDFRLIYGKEDKSAGRAFAIELSTFFSSEFSGLRLMPSDDTEEETAAEILVGETNRPLSAELKAEVRKADGGNDLCWGVACRDSQFAIYYSCAEAKSYALAYLKGTYFKDGSFTAKDGLTEVKVVTRAAYEQALADQKAEEERRADERLREQAEKAKQAIAEFTVSDFGGGNITTDLAAKAGKSYAKPLAYPTSGQHPRVLFTAADIPNILAAMEEPENSAAKSEFMARVQAETDGILPAPTEQNNGLHNFDAKVLATIQSKAMYYQLSGKAVYGYQAILAMKNYLKTLDIQYIQSDQTRQFGYVMYITACVYDWCHDLLTADDKVQLVAGVEHNLLTGTTPVTDSRTTNGGAKMEMGFPPSKQGSVTGHGSEMQLLRDYLSFSIAVFDEYSGWYEFIAGRFYQDFVGIRNVYYNAGIYPQGVSVYAPWRHLADLYSAWLLKAATGVMPYDETMENVLPSLFATETIDKRAFPSGDGTAGATGIAVSSRLSAGAMINSYLFDNGAMRAQAKYYGSGFSSFGYGVANLTAAESLICSSGGTKTAADRHSATGMIHFNGGYFNQFIIRNSYNADVAMTLMKGAGRMTGNHDHGDAGTFQIYYKGFLSSNAGVYDSYGTDHHYYFHQATVSKNGLLIYNPSLASSNKGWYSGSQKRNSESGTLSAWQDNSGYDTGTTFGTAYAYDADGNPLYAYIGANLTAAYDAQTVSDVERSMLTAYTNNADVPMVLFVFDKIDAKSEAYKKIFLLQCPTEPAIDTENKTVTIVNGGKLVLQNLAGGDHIDGYGGAGSEFYISGSGKNLSCNDGSTDGMWGHVEISPDTGSKSNLLFNVLYVTDTDKTGVVKATKIETDTAVGAQILDLVTVFKKDKKYDSRKEIFTVSGDKTLTYRIAGLAAGTWNVTVGSDSLGDFTVKEGEGILTFNAPAGTVVLTPGNDIRPENSGTVTYRANGGTLPENAPAYFIYGQNTKLPTPSRGTDLFLGWFKDEKCTIPISEISSSETAEDVTVYAAWTTVFFDEHYEGGNLTVSHNNEDDKAVYTVMGGENGYYMHWTSTGGGPQILRSGGYGGATETGKISILARLGKAGEDPVMPTLFRVRNAGKAIEIKVFTTDAAGNVKLGNSNVVLANLSSADGLVTLRIVLDFTSQTVEAYSEDGNILDQTAMPNTSSYATPEEYLATFTQEQMAWRCQNSGSILIGSVSATDGNIFARKSPS